MKLPYLGLHNPILSHFTNHFSGKGHGRQTSTRPATLPVTTSRFHFHRAAPHHLKGGQWQLQPLRQANAALTYEATLTYSTALILQSRDTHLAEPYTWQDHLQQLEVVEQEHQTYKSFSFILLNKAASKCLGMVRIMPLRPFLYYNNAPTHLIIRAGDNAAMITYWLAPCPDDTTFACEFIQTLQRWFSRDWEFVDFYFRINPSDSHCLATLADTGLAAHFSLKVPPDNYVFYSN